MQELLIAVIAGDEAAWHRLCLDILPTLEGIARKRRITGELSEREDECDTMVAAMLAALQADDWRRLRAYLASCEQHREGSFRRWLGTVAANIAHDYVRAHPEYLRPPAGQAGSQESGEFWVRHEPMPDSCAEPPPSSGGPDAAEAAMALRILKRASALPPDQREALWLRLADQDDETIARRLSLPDARAADRLVRSAMGRLRRQFNPRGRNQ